MLFFCAFCEVKKRYFSCSFSIKLIKFSKIFDSKIVSDFLLYPQTLKITKIFTHRTICFNYFKKRNDTISLWNSENVCYF